MNRVYKSILKVFIAIVLAVCFIPNVIAESGISFKECEYTTNYKKWLNLSEEEKTKIEEPPMCKTEDDFYIGNKQRNTKSGSSASINDSIYSSAEHDYITSTKDQGSYGTCWTFSSSANIETALIKEGKYGLTKNDIDLSEAHLSIATSDKVNILPFKRTYDDGGNPIIHSTAYYMDRLGPIDDELMPFSIMDQIKYNYLNITEDDITNKKAQYNVNDALIYSAGEEKACTTNQITSIKQYIIDKGSITAAIFTDLVTWNSEEERYYFYSDNTELQNGHSILIIGWDDDIPAEAFENRAGGIPTRNGGWIIKNSWGYPNYDYVSYDDVHICTNLAGFSNIEEGREDNTYIYDILGSSTTVKSTTNTSLYVANIFDKKTSKKEELSKISFYSSVAGQEYSILYSPTGSFSDLSTIYSGTANKAGYTTIKVTGAEITNDQFIVGVEYKMHNDTTVVPIYKYNENSIWYDMTVPNVVSYVSANGTSFNNFVGQNGENYIAPVRAYTNNIGSINISTATITGIVNKTYTGSAITQNITVKYDNQTLTQGTDYVVTYSNNTNAGTAEMTITGKGDYTGSITKTFTINPASISDFTVTGIVNKTYTGSTLTQTITVTKGSTNLASNDYTVAYSNNINAGTATLVITGQGNYTGTIEKTFTINPANISGCTVSGIVNKTYTGSEITQNITVLKSTKSLTSNDYTVTYSNNINAGTATVVITGKGNYTGTINKTFTINPASMSLVTTKGLTSKTYTGEAILQNLTITYNNQNLTPETDYTLVYSNNINVGTAEIRITGKNNYTGTITRTFIINPKSLQYTNVTLESTQYTYIGAKIEPNVVVKIDNITLINNTDYTVTYSNNIYAGTATVSTVGKGNYTGTINKTFIINPIDLSDSTVTGAVSKAYTGSYLTQSSLIVRWNGIRLLEDRDYYVSYNNNRYIGTATYSIIGKGNFTGETIAKAFNIVPQKVTIYKPVAGIKKVTIKYKKSIGNVKYQIAYKLKTSSTWKYIRTSKTSYTKTKLKSNKYYNIKVRAYKIVNNRTYYGAWSTTKTVKIK